MVRTINIGFRLFRETTTHPCLEYLSSRVVGFRALGLGFATFQNLGIMENQAKKKNGNQIETGNLQGL